VVQVWCIRRCYNNGCREPLNGTYRDLAGSGPSGEYKSSDSCGRDMTSFRQLIARIQTPNPNVRNQINNLLTLVGRYHPQALIYPLTVASMSNNELRKEAATEIMNKLREHSANLVEQVCLSQTPQSSLSNNPPLGSYCESRTHTSCHLMARTMARIP
jgi:hypothetical protein